MPLPPVRHRIERLLAHADVRVDGDRPWDLQLRDERFFARALLQGSLGLGESYMDGWWETASLDGLVHRLLSAQLDERTRGLGDFVDTLRAHLVPAGRFISAWIHNGQPADIESVMVNGQFVMRNGKVLTMDEGSVIAETDKVGRRIWDQVRAAGPIAVPRLPRPK